MTSKTGYKPILSFKQKVSIYLNKGEY